MRSRPLTSLSSPSAPQYDSGPCQDLEGLVPATQPGDPVRRWGDFVIADGQVAVLARDGVRFP